MRRIREDLAVLRELRELRKKLYRSVVVDLGEFGNLDDPTSPIQVTLVLVTIVRGTLFAASLAVQFRRRFAADGIDLSPDKQRGEDEADSITSR